MSVELVLSQFVELNRTRCRIVIGDAIKLRLRRRQRNTVVKMVVLLFGLPLRSLCFRRDATLFSL
jgi:hypothetical protein